MKKIIWLIFLALLGGGARAQNVNNPCECSYYASFRSQVQPETYFPPQTMKELGVREVKIFILPRHRIDTAIGTNQLVVRGELPEEYMVLRMEINAAGWVSKKIYSHDGQPSNVEEYLRDAEGRILERAIYYLDSLGQYFAGFGKEIEDYTYDDQKRLLKVQKRDREGKVIPGEGYDYTQFEYDEQGRRIKSISRIGGELPHFELRNVEEVRYEDPTHSISTWTNKKDSSSYCFASEYDLAGREIQRDYSPGSFGSSSVQSRWTYDEKGRRSSFESKYTGDDVVSECPDNMNYREEYHYDPEGFLTSMIHSYGKIECVFRVELAR